MSRNHNRMLIPGQQKVQINHLPMPIAQPIPLVLNQPGQTQLTIIGGLTKLEYAAIHLGGNVDRARELLDECKRVQKEIDEAEKNNQANAVAAGSHG